MPVVQRIARAVKEAFAADGLLVMQFNEPAAGQTVFHLHFHVIPRFEGTPRPHTGQMERPEVLAANAEKVRGARVGPLIGPALAPCVACEQEAAMSHILVIGASRGIGLETVRAALATGHHVRALARSAASIPVENPRLEKIAGDALDRPWSSARCKAWTASSRRSAWPSARPP